jgi:DNA-binding GntR family transcriptional regulator
MKKTLADHIYDTLRKDIIELRIKPGEKLSEAQLAKRFNVSRAPIRGVIQKLQQEEFVLVKPQIGTIIMPISFKKARDILEVRLLLEPYAAEIAARNVTDDDLEVLKFNLERLAKKQDDLEAQREKLFAADSLLHQTIWRLSGNKEIYTIINTYRDEIQRIRLATLELADRFIPSEKEMWQIYEALAQRDPERAREVMYVHLSNIKSALESIAEKREYDDERENIA